MRKIAGGLRYPSGPVAMADGSLLVVEIEGGDLVRIDPDGTCSAIAGCGGGPNGAAIGPDGAVYVCNNGGLSFRSEMGVRRPTALAEGNVGGCLQRVDLRSGVIDVVYTHVDGVALGSLNDIVFDDSGWCYFVDTTNGTILHADTSGSAIRTVADGLAFPNGIDLSADGQTLFVSETYSGRMLAFAVRADILGSLDVVLEGATHWDGIAIDTAGHICAANLEGAGITAITRDGRIAHTVRVPEYDPHVTNICFGGPDLRTAFITSSGQGAVYATDWPWSGLPLRFTA